MNFEIFGHEWFSPDGKAVHYDLQTPRGQRRFRPAGMNWRGLPSAASRTEFMQVFPLASGTCDIGLTTNAGVPCNSTLIPDFRAVEDSLWIDASFRYDVNDHISFTAEAVDLTNDPTQKWAYRDVQQAQQYLSTGRIFTVGFRMMN